METGEAEEEEAREKVVKGQVFPGLEGKKVVAVVHIPNKTRLEGRYGLSRLEESRREENRLQQVYYTMKVGGILPERYNEGTQLLAEDSDSVVLFASGDSYPTSRS